MSRNAKLPNVVIFRWLMVVTLAASIHPAVIRADEPQQAQADAQQQNILFHHAVVIDGSGAQASRNAWVHVQDGRIAAVGDGKPPDVKGAKSIDLTGKTLLPGLADMHAHLFKLESARWMLKLLLAHGITTVMDPSNSLGNIAAIRRWTHVETVVPHLYVSSPAMQGSYSEQRFLQPGAEIDKLVEEYAAFDVDFIKVYNWLSSAGLRQVGERARELGMRVTGHTPLSQNSVGAIDAGIEILQHLRLRPYEVIDDVNVIAEFPVDGSLMKRTGYWAHFDPQGQNLARTLDAWERRKDQFFVTPTLVVHGAVAESMTYPDGDFEDDADLALISEAMRNEFREKSPPTFWGKLSAAEIDDAKRAVGGMAGFVRLAHQRGIRILSGTDTPVPWLVPGPSLHDELYAFVELSGMTPEEAIRTSTGRVGEALELSDRGLIKAGYVADLVVVHGDVSGDIRALDHIEQVILGGQGYSRKELLGQSRLWADQDTAATSPW